MDNTRRLHIGITKSVLKKIYVEFDEKGVNRLYCTVGLLTEGGREVAEHTAWAGSYHKEIELTEQLSRMLLATGLLLHGLTERHMMGLDGLLGAPAEDAPSDS